MEIKVGGGFDLNKLDKIKQDQREK